MMLRQRLFHVFFGFMILSVSINLLSAGMNSAVNPEHTPPEVYCDKGLLHSCTPPPAAVNPYLEHYNSRFAR